MDTSGRFYTFQGDYIVCNVCRLTTDAKLEDDLYKHYNSTHRSKKQRGEFPCSVCGREFNLPSTRNGHKCGPRKERKTKEKPEQSVENVNLNKTTPLGEIAGQTSLFEELDTSQGKIPLPETKKSTLLYVCDQVGCNAKYKDGERLRIHCRTTHHRELTILPEPMTNIEAREYKTKQIKERDEKILADEKMALERKKEELDSLREEKRQIEIDAIRVRDENRKIEIQKMEELRLMEEEIRLRREKIQKEAEDERKKIQQEAEIIKKKIQQDIDNEKRKLASLSKTEQNECCICLDNETTMAAVPCGHKSYCEDCSLTIIGQQCAICRVYVERFIKVF
jgi:hypothetical protein